MKKTNTTSNAFNWKIWLPVFVISGMVAVKITWFSAQSWRAATGVHTDKPLPENHVNWLSQNGLAAPLIDASLHKTVTDAIHEQGLNVEYWLQDRLYETELYTNSPIEVVYVVKNKKFYTQSFDFSYTGSNRYKLSYNYNGVDRQREGEIGKPVHEAEINITVNWKNEQAPHSPVLGNVIRFTVFSDDALAEHLLAKSVRVSNDDNGGIVSVTSTAPAKAQWLANRLAGPLSGQQKVNLEAIDHQLENATTELERTRNNWNLYRQTNGQPVWAGMENATVRHLLETKTELELQQLALDNLNQYMRDNRLSGNAVPDFGTITDPVFTQYITSLNEKIAKRKVLGGSQATMLDNEIEFLKTTLAEGIRNTRKKTALQLDEINKRIATTTTLHPGTPDLATRWNELQSDYQYAEQFYNFMISKKMEADYHEFANETGNYTEAALPIYPVNPDNRVVWASCMAGALALSWLLSLLAGRNRQPQNTRNALRVIGQLGQEGRKQAPREMADLCTNLLTLHKQEGAQVISVTSQKRGEGKSYVAAGLAKSFAAHDLKVLVIDMNSVHADMESRFDVSPGQKLADVMDNTISLEEAVRITSIPQVDLLTGGVTEGINTLLATGKLRGVINTLKSKYDLVIIDTEALDGSMEAVSLVKMSDTGIMVLDPSARESEVSGNMKVLKDVYEVNNLYFVMNRPGRAIKHKARVVSMNSGRELHGPKKDIPLFKRAALWFY